MDDGPEGRSHGESNPTDPRRTSEAGTPAWAIKRGFCASGRVGREGPPEHGTASRARGWTCAWIDPLGAPVRGTDSTLCGAAPRAHLQQVEAAGGIERNLRRQAQGWGNRASATPNGGARQSLHIMLGSPAQARRVARAGSIAGYPRREKPLGAEDKATSLPAVKR